MVFTLQSIKSRIETGWWNGCNGKCIKFLLYSPLNQGLKQNLNTDFPDRLRVFLLYSPLNQGLKHAYIRGEFVNLNGFLLYSPLNQGLKL